MSADGLCARDLRAVSAFRGLPESLDRTLPLGGDEHVILEGTLRFYRSPVSQPITYLRLTSDRLLLLRHYAFRPDLVTEVPRRAVQTLDRHGARLRMAWTDQDGTLSVVSLAPWSGRQPARRSMRDLDQLFMDLRSWLPFSVG